MILRVTIVVFCAAAAVYDLELRWLWIGIALLELAAWIDARAFRAGMAAERKIQERQ